MTEFYAGDIVRVQMPRGYTGRGLLSISLMFSTHPEAKFEGAIGTVGEINPSGPQSVHQYLVDFRTHDNSKIGIPWQAQWFREEWLDLVERSAAVMATARGGSGPDATWPERSAPEAEAENPLTIAHPGAKLFSEGRRDFAPAGSEPERNLGYTGPTRADDRSGADVPAFEPTPDTMSGVVDSTTPTNAPGAEVPITVEIDDDDYDPLEDLSAGKDQP